MIEFDENLNPIEGGKPTGNDLPPAHNSPEPTPPSEGPRSEGPRSEGPRGTEGPTEGPPLVPPPPPPSAGPRGTEGPPHGGGVGTGLLWVAVLGLIAVSIVAITIGTGGSDSSIDRTEGITVSGEGVAYATADIAKVRFGVQETARSVVTVRERIDNKIDRIKNELDELDVDDKDIKTVEFSLYPERNYRYEPPRITGYTSRHSFVVTIRDLDDINDIVDGITKAGANDVSNVTFDLDDTEEWVEEAREDAIDEAKDKAKSIAKNADVKLGKLISIQEYVGGINEPQYRLDYGMGGGDEIEVGPGIEPGSQEIRVTVTLTYKIG